MMDKKKKFNANLYAAFLEGKTTKEENRIVLTRISKSPSLILELNLASAVCRNSKILRLPSND